MSISIKKLKLTLENINSDEFMVLKESISNELSKLVKSQLGEKHGVELDQEGRMRTYGKSYSPQFLGSFVIKDSTVEIKGMVTFGNWSFLIFLPVLLIPLFAFLMAIFQITGPENIPVSGMFLLLMIVVAGVNLIGVLRFGKEIEKVIIKAATPYLVSRA